MIGGAKKKDIETTLENYAYYISYKEEKITDEILNAKKAMSLLGAKLDKQVEFVIPYTEINRNLLVIHKYKKTPANYPRKAGVPSKMRYHMLLLKTNYL